MPSAADNNSPRKAPSYRDDALSVLLRLRDAGHIAYFAGGSVRDLLLGLDAKDFDVATDAPPDRVRNLFKNTQAVGQAFGVILVRTGRSVIEVATFRNDGAYLDGRRPESVTFSTPEEDARRRDFTINGLFLDPVSNQVIDFVDGQTDIRLRRIRAIGDPSARFAEDYLRLLRAVRFASRLKFDIEPATANAIRREASSIIRISPERIAEELRTMLSAEMRATAWQWLWDLQLIHPVMRHLHIESAPSLNLDRSLFLAFSGNGPVPFGFALVAAMLDYHLQAGADLAMLLNRSTGQKFAQIARQSLKVSNEESDQIVGTLQNLEALLSQPTLAQKMRVIAHPQGSLARLLLPALAAIGFRADSVRTIATELDSLAINDCSPAPFITGDDLIANGMTPGRQFKQVLDAVYDAQLEARVTTAETAMRLAKSLMAAR